MIVKAQQMARMNRRSGSAVICGREPSPVSIGSAKEPQAAPVDQLFDLTMHETSKDNDEENQKSVAVIGEEFVALNNGDNADSSDNPKAVNFETAISLAGHGRFHSVLLLGCGFCLVAMISEILGTAYLLPAAQCDFNMSSSDKGLLSAISYLGMITSSHLWGFLADTRGRRMMLICALLTDGFCAVASSFSHSYWLFVTFRFFNGFFICAPSAVTYAYLGEFHTDRTRARAIMWGAVFISSAILVLPGAAWLLMSYHWSVSVFGLQYRAWRLFVVMCGVPSFIAAGLLLGAVPESPKFLLAKGREKEALAVLQYMYFLNTGRPRYTYKVKALLKESPLKMNKLEVYREENTETPKKSPGVLKQMWSQTIPLFRGTHLRSTLLSCVLMFGIFASFNGLLLWLPEMFSRMSEFAERFPEVGSATVCDAINVLYANSSGAVLNDGLENVTMSSLCETFEVAPVVFQKSLIIGASSAFANIIVGLVINRVGKKNILVSCLLISGLAGLALLIVRSSIAMLTFSSILEALTMTSPSVLNSIIVDIFPTQLRAMAVCMAMLMGRVGTVTSSLILGLLLEVNCALVFMFLGGILLVGGLLSLLLPSPWQWRIVPK